MHFFKAIFAAVFATGTAASTLPAASRTAGFTLPAGLQNGVYRAYYDKDGREVHELVKAAENGTVNLRRGTTDSEERSFINKRQSPGFFLYDGIWCGCGFNLDHGNCDAAVSNLENQLNVPGGDDSNCAWIDANMSFYAISNDVVAFACNWQTTVSICGSDLAYSLQQITNSCGWYVAGTQLLEIDWVTPDPIPYPVGYLNLGYMQYFGGENFCAAATAGTTDHC